MFEFRQMSDELKPYCSGENIFDFYRLVDPKTHEVYKYENNSKLELQESKCYELWDRKDGCPNCIARHAYTKQRQYMKLEFMYGKVLLIFAKPIKLGEKMFVLEMIKDITSSMMGFNYYRAENKDVENIVSQFNELAVKDILTGLYNQEYINNYIEDFLQKEVAFNKLTAVAIDIDDYTKINSSYGYNVGNEVLQHIAGIIEKCVISYGGVASRLGPDEMGLFFTNKDVEEVEAICRELHSEITDKPVNIQGNEIRIGITYSVTGIRNDDEPEDFIGRMYFNLRAAQGRK